MDSGLKINAEKIKLLTKETYTNEVKINDRTSNPLHEPTFLGQNIYLLKTIQKKKSI